MEEDERVMSEVHLGCPPDLSDHRHVSLFNVQADFRLSDNCQIREKRNPDKTIRLDSDGDLILRRRNKFSHKIEYDNHIHQHNLSSRDCDAGSLYPSREANNGEGNMKFVLTIQHNITSSLSRVGLQVWRAALVLADFILHRGFTSYLGGITALELGAGTGLVGIVSALFARTVFITDIGSEVLENCEANVQLNSSLPRICNASIHVRELDWREQWPPETSSCKRYNYSWMPSDIEKAEQASVLLAADVIYNDELTDSFFRMLEAMMSRGFKKVLYLALEKRYNFTLEDLDVVASGYGHFRSYLKDEEDCRRGDSNLPCFMGKQIDMSQIPQYIIEYERGKDLELWEITYLS